MSKLEYIYIPAPGDRETVLQHIKELSQQTDQQILDACAHSVQLGIVGSRAQALYLIALRKVMIDRFNRSPIYVKDGYIIGIEEEMPNSTIQ